MPAGRFWRLRRPAGGSDAVPAARLPVGGTWNGIVGVRDVNPTTRTKFGSTLAASSTAADINTAISGASADQYVELASGVFSVNADLVFTTDRKTLRGQVDANGNPTTTLRFTSSSLFIEMYKTTWDFGSTGVGAFTNTTVNSGKTRGSTQVQLASTSGLTAGRLMWFSANESGTDIDGGNGWTDFGGNAGRAFSVVVKVTAVNGTTVDFTPALNNDYLSGITLNAHWRTAGSQLDYCGIENCIIEVGTASYFNGVGIFAQGCNQCWVRNCRVLRIGAVSSLNALVYLYGCYGFELLHSKLAGTNDAGNSSMYAMATFDCSGLLIANNVMTDTSNGWPMLMTSGSVFAYNYVFDMNYGAFQSQWIFHHGGHDHFNLTEGNWIAGGYIMDDPTNGGNPTHSYATLHCRDRIVGKDVAGGSNTNLNCIRYDGAHKAVTVAACVLGLDGVQQYELIHSGITGGTGQDEGYCFDFQTGTNTNELLRLGNYNTATDSIPAAETAALGGNVVLTSYAYASKPAFFGDRPWPWCTPSNFSQSDTLTNLPSGYRETNGALPPGATL